MTSNFSGDVKSALKNKPVLMKYLFIALIILMSFMTTVAAEVLPDRQEIVKARVISAENKEGKVQELQVVLLGGEQKGKVMKFENEYIPLAPGEAFYVRHITESGGSEYFSVADPYRLPALAGLIAIFVILAIVVGGMQGVRGLVSLLGSLLLIVYVLLPGILGGFNILAVSIGVAALIIILGSFITHGFNRTTLSAVIGMITTVIATGVLGFFAVRWTRLSGYTDEQVTYLALNLQGQIDVVGLLFAGIMIGLLGVLYDVAIGQAIAVEELVRAASTSVFSRAMRIGREHIGALVNTLAIAYVGATLPLLLLFYQANVPFLINFNSEIIATEVVRILIGSIGLILAVPITTLLSVYMLKNMTFEKSDTHSHLHHHSH